MDHRHSRQGPGRSGRSRYRFGDPERRALGQHEALRHRSAQRDAAVRSPGRPEGGQRWRHHHPECRGRTRLDRAHERQGIRQQPAVPDRVHLVHGQWTGGPGRNRLRQRRDDRQQGRAVDRRRPGLDAADRAVEVRQPGQGQALQGGGLDHHGPRHVHRRQRRPYGVHRRHPHGQPRRLRDGARREDRQGELPARRQRQQPRADGCHRPVHDRCRCRPRRQGHQCHDHAEGRRRVRPGAVLLRELPDLPHRGQGPGQHRGLRQLGEPQRPPPGHRFGEGPRVQERQERPAQHHRA